MTLAKTRQIVKDHLPAGVSASCFAVLYLLITQIQAVDTKVERLSERVVECRGDMRIQGPR